MCRPTFAAVVIVTRDGFKYGHRETVDMNVIVTGGSGFLGRQFRAIYSKKYEVVGMSYTSDHDGLSTVDIRNGEAVEEFIHQIDPDAVVHMAGIADPDECHRNEVKAFEINRDGTETVAQASEQVSAKLIYVSTSFVFSKPGTYDTDAAPTPNTVYGQSKYEGELEVRDHHSDYGIIRCPKLFGGDVRTPTEEIVSSIVGALSSRGRIELDDTIERFPTLIKDVLAVIQQVLETDGQGTYHVSTHTPFTKYEFGRAVAETFDLDGDVIATSTDAIAERPSGIELSTETAERLGIEITPVTKALRELRRRS